jgi:hypothetical protein
LLLAERLLMEQPVVLPLLRESVVQRISDWRSNDRDHAERLIEREQLQRRTEPMKPGWTQMLMSRPMPTPLQTQKLNPKRPKMYRGVLKWKVNAHTTRAERFRWLDAG